MNTRDIEYYVQIVKQKNFTKVAKYFQVSQPTITYALQRLEKELGASTYYKRSFPPRIDYHTSWKTIISPCTIDFTRN